MEGQTAERHKTLSGFKDMRWHLDCFCVCDLFSKNSNSFLQMLGGPGSLSVCANSFLCQRKRGEKKKCVYVHVPCVFA